jgi:hypothetical protein
MASGNWQFWRSEQVKAALPLALQHIKSDLRACSARVEDAEDKAEECFNRLDELKAFELAIQRLEDRKEDVTRLPRVLDLSGEPIPFIHILAHDRWIAYFRVDPAEKVAVAMLVFEDVTNEKMMEALEAALSKKP